MFLSWRSALIHHASATATAKYMYTDAHRCLAHDGQLAGVSAGKSTVSAGNLCTFQIKLVRKLYGMCDYYRLQNLIENVAEIVFAVIKVETVKEAAQLRGIINEIYCPMINEIRRCGANVEFL